MQTEWQEAAVLGRVVREGLSMEVAFGHGADFTYNLLITHV